MYIFGIGGWFLKQLTKHIRAFKAFGVRGRPKQPWKAQEGFQEAPEELQNFKNNPNMDLFFDQQFGLILESFWDRFLHQ